MSPIAFEQAVKEGGWVNLSSRTKLKITGSDRLRYLNGQLTNDVKKVSPQTALYACVTNAKGRIQADVYAHGSAAEAEAYWLDAEPGLRESLAQRLDKYLVADDVEIQDVTEDWRLIHLFGPAALTSLALPESVRRVKINRVGWEGVDLWYSASESIPALAAQEVSAEDWENLYILQGIPRWPAELSEEAFPQEAGLEARALDFFKGCYIGQEVISRIKTTGKMPHTLVKFQAGESISTSLSPSAWQEVRLWIPGDEQPLREAGRVTSVCLHPLLDRWKGLAYVRQNVTPAHSVLLAGQEPHRILGEIEITAS